MDLNLRVLVKDLTAHFPPVRRRSGQRSDINFESMYMLLKVCR
jgi:hypothetical protein